MRLSLVDLLLVVLATAAVKSSVSALVLPPTLTSLQSGVMMMGRVQHLHPPFPPPYSFRRRPESPCERRWIHLLQLSSTRTSDDDFTSSFASSATDRRIQEDPKKSKNSPAAAAAAASFAATSRTQKSTPPEEESERCWQADLERLLDPTTLPAQRQILLSNLLNANAEIQASVQEALRDRKIDPLLTPTGRKLQDGTRAVARQLTNDILPSLRPNSTNKNNNAALPAIPLPPIPSPQDFSKFGNRFINAVSNQMQRNLAQLQQDLANPAQIPARISQQTEEFLQEASNIFAETPVGLKEPPYTVIFKTDDYEIRDYQAYMVATTSMNLNSANDDDVMNTAVAATEQGLAFNTLAAYIFGNNANNQVMDMTTPVTTTASGEMRFYLADADDADSVPPPQPLSEDAAVHWFETEHRKIRLERIPAARLAVRRFGGFATAGEIARQKAQLLAALQLDEGRVEIDVPHGQTVGHVIFQYNPPYTLPALRRNEIAVPVVTVSSAEPMEGQQKQPEAVVVPDDPWDLTTNTNGATKETKLPTSSSS